MTTTAQTKHTAGRMTGRKMLNKVPEVTIFFWVIKIMCTTVGETAADYLNVDLGFGLTNTTYVTGAVLGVLRFSSSARAATCRRRTGPWSSSSASSAL